jgi:hypothetical protein
MRFLLCQPLDPGPCRPPRHHARSRLRRRRRSERLETRATSCCGSTSAPASRAQPLPPRRLRDEDTLSSDLVGGRCFDPVVGCEVLHYAKDVPAALERFRHRECLPSDGRQSSPPRRWMCWRSRDAVDQRQLLGLQLGCVASKQTNESASVARAALVSVDPRGGRPVRGAAGADCAVL